MSTNTAMLVYKQTILPYFEYCDFLNRCLLQKGTAQNRKIAISGSTDNTQNKKSKRGEESGFIAAIRNERVKDKKEMPPAEPDA